MICRCIKGFHPVKRVQMAGQMSPSGWLPQSGILKLPCVIKNCFFQHLPTRPFSSCSVLSVNMHSNETRWKTLLTVLRTPTMRTYLHREEYHLFIIIIIIIIMFLFPRCKFNIYARCQNIGFELPLATEQPRCLVGN